MLSFFIQSSNYMGTPLPAQMYFLKLYLDLIEGKNRKKNAINRAKPISYPSENKWIPVQCKQPGSQREIMHSVSYDNILCIYLPCLFLVIALFTYTLTSHESFSSTQQLTKEKPVVV